MLNKTTIIDDIAEKGWSLQQNVFSQEFIKSLNQTLQERQFKIAGIGHNKDIITTIRNDYICWLEPDDYNPQVQSYMEQIKELSKELNEAFYLNIRNFELHFAQYNQGGFYKPHYDNFEGKNKRRVTIITYLNEDWKPEYGGYLKLHQKDKIIEIEPKAGNVAIFLSQDVLHEVSPSFQTRKSLTGWLLNS